MSHLRGGNDNSWLSRVNRKVQSSRSLQVERMRIFSRYIPNIPIGLLTRRMQFILDLLALTASFLFAYLLRFEFVIPQKELFGAFVQLPYVVLIQIVALAVAGVYSFIWRYVGMREARSFVYAFSGRLSFSGSPVHASGSVRRLARPPLRDLDGLRSSASWGCSASGWRGGPSARGRKRADAACARSSGEHIPTLFFGAGEAGVMAAREIGGRARYGPRRPGLPRRRPQEAGDGHPRASRSSGRVQICRAS